MPLVTLASLFLPWSKRQLWLLILTPTPTLLWVGLGLEALICLLSTYPNHSYLNLRSPVPCPASAMTTPLL